MDISDRSLLSRVMEARACGRRYSCPELPGRSGEHQGCVSGWGTGQISAPHIFTPFPLSVTGGSISFAVLGLQQRGAIAAGLQWEEWEWKPFTKWFLQTNAGVLVFFLSIKPVFVVFPS